MKHLDYYRQEKDGKRTVGVSDVYWGDNPRSRFYCGIFQKENVVKVRRYLDDSGKRRVTVEIEVEERS